MGVFSEYAGMSKRDRKRHKAYMGKLKRSFVGLPASVPSGRVLMAMWRDRMRREGMEVRASAESAGEGDLYSDSQFEEMPLMSSWQPYADDDGFLPSGVDAHTCSEPEPVYDMNAHEVWPVPCPCPLCTGSEGEI